ncbi:hypothetical protein FB451DRAFT_1483931, partial [Mycena latifolia]
IPQLVHASSAPKTPPALAWLPVHPRAALRRRLRRGCSTVIQNDEGRRGLGKPSAALDYTACGADVLQGYKPTAGPAGSRLRLATTQRTTLHLCLQSHHRMPHAQKHSRIRGRLSGAHLHPRAPHPSRALEPSLSLQRGLSFLRCTHGTVPCRERCRVKSISSHQFQKFHSNLLEHMHFLNGVFSVSFEPSVSSSGLFLTV